MTGWSACASNACETLPSAAANRPIPRDPGVPFVGHFVPIACSKDSTIWSSTRWTGGSDSRTEGMSTPSRRPWIDHMDTRPHVGPDRTPVTRRRRIVHGRPRRVQPCTHGNHATVQPLSRHHMPMKTEVPLCDCLGVDVDGRRFAVLDELTLTYNVVERKPGEPTRVLQKHVATLREARAYGCDECGPRSRAGRRDLVTQC